MDNLELLKTLAYASIIPLIFILDYLYTKYPKFRGFLIAIAWIITPIFLGVIIFYLLMSVVGKLAPSVS